MSRCRSFSRSLSFSRALWGSSTALDGVGQGPGKQSSTQSSTMVENGPEGCSALRPRKLGATPCLCVASTAQTEQHRVPPTQAVPVQAGRPMTREMWRPCTHKPPRAGLLCHWQQQRPAACTAHSSHSLYCSARRPQNTCWPCRTTQNNLSAASPSVESPTSDRFSPCYPARPAQVLSCKASASTAHKSWLLTEALHCQRGTRAKPFPGACRPGSSWETAHSACA